MRGFHKYLKTGEKFGKWTIICRAPSHKTLSGGHIAYYLAKCECGTEKEVRATNLVSGKSICCGCYDWRNYSQGQASRNAAYSGYRYGAKKRGLSWEIDKDYFELITSKDCWYCGAKPIPRGNKAYRGKCNLNGIDRVDSNLGYLPDNCIPCCSDCNIMRSDRTVEEFVRQVEKIYLNLKGRV